MSDINKNNIYRYIDIDIDMTKNKNSAWICLD